MEQKRQDKESNAESTGAAREVVNNTIRIARLKLLFIAAKITGHSNTHEVKYPRKTVEYQGFFGAWNILMNASGR